MSDSHDNMPAIRKAVDFFNSRGAELVLHAGDIVSPFTAAEFGKLKAKFTGVFGNNDGDKPYLLERFKDIGTINHDPFELTAGGKKIVLMHQPKFIEQLLADSKFDVVVYGHTHKIDIRKGKSLVINPGETGGWLSGRQTVALLDTDEMRPEIFDI